MRAPGIIGTIQLAAVLALALPAMLFGLDWWLRGGRPLGVVFVALGVLMLVLHHQLTNPIDPGDIAGVVLDRVGRNGKQR